MNSRLIATFSKPPGDPELSQINSLANLYKYYSLNAYDNSSRTVWEYMMEFLKSHSHDTNMKQRLDEIYTTTPNSINNPLNGSMTGEQWINLIINQYNLDGILNEIKGEPASKRQRIE
eukprot:NODE_603_length_5511_cov_0.288987.p3 type:complete len:118 gc:universal NODE_603_length_5511_cov_0.288987:569-216(-)